MAIKQPAFQVVACRFASTAGANIQLILFLLVAAMREDDAILRMNEQFSGS